MISGVVAVMSPQNSIAGHKNESGQGPRIALLATDEVALHRRPDTTSYSPWSKHLDNSTSTHIESVVEALVRICQSARFRP
jgi:hypothetical protein